ncbi:MAG: hypothetical protein IJA78_00155 [Clostridia bacterium]|nr:hypothetical protein [Clostridia bacterium]
MNAPFALAPCHLSPEVIRQNNNDLVQLFSLYLNLMPSSVAPEQVEALATDCGISRAEAYAHLLAAMAGLDAGGADRNFFWHWLLPAIHELSPADYTNDPYFQNIRIPSAHSGKWQLKTETLHPFEAFVCNDFLVTPDRRMIPQIGFFKEAYPFPAVLESGREWMTLQPNEMVTTKPAIQKAHGRVLTFGLGLGYFAYHAAEKENVESVTVVDVSEDVIDLFRTHILPQFPHREKVQLIKADAFEFADTRMAGNFDFVFADIWHDAGDGKELYLRMKQYEAKHPEIDFSFWLEDTIRCYLEPDLW